MSRALTVAAAAGVVTGLLSTFPWELGPAASLPFWALAGVAVGTVVGRGRAVLGGVGYGVALTFAFLYSRYGGSAGHLPAYTVFVAAMAVGGALAGVATAYVGSRLRRGRPRVSAATPARS